MPNAQAPSPGSPALQSKDDLGQQTAPITFEWHVGSHVGLDFGDLTLMSLNSDLIWSTESRPSASPPYS